jgi:hypothetical protein
MRSYIHMYIYIYTHTCMYAYIQEQAFQLISKYQAKYEEEVDDVTVAQKVVDSGAESVIARLKSESEYVALVAKYMAEKSEMQV